MKLSAHQTLLPGANLSERFQRAAECGLDGIELAFGRRARPYDLQAEIETAMAASGLPVGSICGTYEGPIVHPDLAERESRLADLIRTLEFADEIGARGVIVVPIFCVKHSCPRCSPPMPDMSPFADDDALSHAIAASPCWLK